jgi:sugar phosphate isomerase/epimerase
MQPHRIKLLERCVLLAKSFKTDRIRCFDYWRLDDQKPYRAVINAKLQRAAERCAKENLILLLENEMSCNTATGEESAAVLKIPDRNFMLNWDPGNAEAIGSTPYPGGYQLLPKTAHWALPLQRRGRKPDGKYEWAPVGGGAMDWVGQLQALTRDGFHYGLRPRNPLARGAVTPETSTRASIGGTQEDAYQGWHLLLISGYLVRL